MANSLAFRLVSAFSSKQCKKMASADTRQRLATPARAAQPQEHIQLQPLQVPGASRDEAEAREAEESSLPAHQPLQQQLLQDHGVNQDEAQASESGESSRGASVYSRSGLELEMLYLHPSEDFLLSIRQVLEKAVDPCVCPRLSGRDGVDEAHAMKMMHGLSAPFRDTLLIVPVSSTPDSPWNGIRLHSTSLTVTPKEFQACKEFIRTSWPRTSVNIYDPFRPGDKWEPKVPGKRGDFWFISGANHDGVRVLQFYVHPAWNQALLSWPRFTFSGDPPTHPGFFASRDIEGHPDMARRRGTKDVEIGQVWYGLTT
jgi:hypothetical protein